MLCSSRLLSKAKAHLLASTLTLAVVALPGVVHATGFVTQRLSAHTISFADANQFSDASLASVTDLALSSAGPGTQNFNWMIPSGSTGFNLVNNTPSGFSNTVPVFSAGTPNDTYAFSVSPLAPYPAVDDITLSHNLGVNVAPAGALDQLANGNNGANYYLDEMSNPAANQSVGVPFFFLVSLPGNYSVIGTAQGDHELLSINPAWTITSNFVFNGIDTIFAAQLNPYSNATPINLEYQIYGATVVPEPSTLSMLGLGLVAAGWRSRRGPKAGVEASRS